VRNAYAWLMTADAGSEFERDLKDLDAARARSGPLVAGVEEATRTATTVDPRRTSEESAAGAPAPATRTTVRATPQWTAS
jgi:hypothetical protein